MSKENQSEKIINDKLNSREFAFDEKAWAGMETLLDAQEKKRRFGFWWWFSIAGFFILTVSGIASYFLINSQGKGFKSQADFTKNEALLEKSKALMQQNKALMGENKASLEKSKASMQQNKALMAENKTSLEKNKALMAENKASLEKSKALLQQNKALMAENKASSEKNKASLQQNNASFEENKAFFVESNTKSEEKPALEEAKEVDKASDSTKTAEQTLLTDSASLAETAKTPLTAPGKETKNAWGALAGVGYWFPYQSTLGPTDTKGVIGFTGGIYYQRAFNKHIELGLSAVYSGRGALNYDKTITNSEFGFGIESDKTTIAPQTLHYLSIPLYLRFNITQRSHLLVGASYYQLLATTSKVTRTTENSFGVIESNTEKQTGEHKGFRKNDIAAFIGYELTLFDRMNAGLQFSYGFYDNTLNVYHPDYSGGVDKNISLQLHLKYDLIRH